MRFHVGSDHGGVTLRRHLVRLLADRGDEVASERGPDDESQSVDYPDVAHEVCTAVTADPGSFGLLVCGTGQGMAIAANKIHGVRAAVVADAYSAKMAREHNDANVLCMGGRVVGPGLASVLLEAFAGASFAGGRHSRRVGKLDPAGG
jgi:ribose 5-phosphate isomerase B